MREAAVPHLSGIPAQQNWTEINKLYDHLNALNIASLEESRAAG